MRIINMEIKAACPSPGKAREILQEMEAVFRGRDHQVDTYFNVAHGRLKLREGNIENNLIFYERPDTKGPGISRCLLHKTVPGTGLKEILAACLGIKTVVDKQREIYYTGNIKIHLDEIQGLGSFLEIEAAGEDGKSHKEDLTEQCRKMMKMLGVREKDLVSGSYSDMMAGE